MATIDHGICSSTSGVVASMPLIVAVSMVSLHPCGTQSTAVGSGDYLRPEDNPFALQIERAEDSLQFHIEEDIVMANPEQDVLVPSPDVATALVLEEGGIAKLRGEAQVEESNDEEDSGDEEESKEVEGDDEEEGDDKEEGDEEAVDGEEVKDKEVEDQGRVNERLDYRSSPGEGSPPALHTWSHSWIRSQAQAINYVDSDSDKVFFSLMPFLSVLCFF